MFKFLKITLNKTRKQYVNTNHLPRIFFLYHKYEKFLHDDYIPKMEFKDFLEFLSLTEFFWAILEEDTNKFAGFVYLDNVIGNSGKLHSAELTTCFEKTFWGEKTYLCAKEFLQYAFDTYGFYKIKAEIYPENFRVKTLLKKCGFEHDCTLKHETLKNGKLQNIELYSLINKKKCEEK